MKLPEIDKLIVALALALQVGNVGAQEQSENSGSNEYQSHSEAYGNREKNYISHFTVTAQPLNLFNDGELRLDFTYRIPHTRSWLQAGLTANLFSYDPCNKHNDYHWFSGSNFASKIGFGLDLNYRFFVSRGWYLAAGPTFRIYGVRYEGYEWHTVNEDGLEYQMQERTMIKQQIYKPGVNFMVGYQKITRHACVIDVFGGIGYRWAVFKYPNKNKFNTEELFSFAYSGLTPLVGIRLGFGKYWKGR